MIIDSRLMVVAPFKEETTMTRPIKITLLLVVAIAAIVWIMSVIPVNAADAPAPSVTKGAVTGTTEIQFTTRTNVDDKGQPAQGAQDTYKCDLVVGKTIGLQG